MHKCSKYAEMWGNGQWLCCFGAQGCTHPLSSDKTSDLSVTSSSGPDQKQESDSAQPSQSLTLTSSSESSLQDFFLILRGLWVGGFNVSVSAQVTPRSAPSHSDTPGLSGCLTKNCQSTEWPACWDAPTLCWRSTTPKSKQHVSFRYNTWFDTEEVD